MIIGALEEKYALPTLLTFLGMARSSCYYQKAGDLRKFCVKENKKHSISQESEQEDHLIEMMEKTPEELLKAYVESQKFSSTTEIMGAMKEIFRDVLQQVMESELETELGYEKSQRVSDPAVEKKGRNYRNGYSSKTVKTQLGAVEVKVPRDRNGEYEPQIIGKYSNHG